MADPDPQATKVLVDEKEKQNTSTSPSMPSPPPLEERRSPTVSDYYASRPKHDKLGNPIPQRKAGAMGAVYGSSKIRLPGDLGANDPRRPRSPATPASALPGDLGPKDPRRPRSPASTSAQAHAVMTGHSRNASDPLDTPTTPGPAEGDRIYKDPKEPSATKLSGTVSPEDDAADADNENDTDREAGSEHRGRGRKRPEPGRTTSGKSVNVRDESEDDGQAATGKSAKPDPTKGESAISFKVTPAVGSRSRSPGFQKKRVHPSTAFDHTPGSGAATPLAGSDDEGRAELREAQKLSLTMSAPHSTPSAHRVIRQIIRGDYAHFQQEAEMGRRRQRMYLVATDLSPESEYALEWTIGTVLRDGDTLFAVYACDLDAASEGGDGGVEIGHGAESVADTAAMLRKMPTANVDPPKSGGGGGIGPSPLSAGSSTPTRSRSRGVFPAAETERRKSLEGITDRCIALLRKTRLQVRVVVEVFHCKSPRHTIIEIIDFLNPTLVVIGSRGRSSMKGVLLGSFSNYLVTKSSVPVMVARKKLRKHGKGDVGMGKVVRNRDGTAVPYTGSGRGRLANVIDAPRGKGLRVQGWDKVGID